MTMKVGVFSPNDPRPWVRKDNINHMLKQERLLVDALLGAGVDVVRGGEGLPDMDQIAWNTRLVQAHVKRIAAESPVALVINQGSWTFPWDSVDAVKSFNAETGDIARVVMFSHKDPQVPGLVAGMAAGGGLTRIGIPYYHIFGDIENDPRVLEELLAVLGFYERRAHAEETAKGVIRDLKRQKYLSLGGMSLKMPTTTADVDQWQKLFGVSFEALDQSELLVRVGRMVEWSGTPGNSEYKIIDDRLKKATDYLSEHGKIDYSREKLRSFSKLVYQLSLYYAGLDITEEYGVTFAGVKCQDELSSRECTACLLTAYMNNDVGPDGEEKPIVPMACENDMDSALTQLIMHLITGKPSGFGDFRDVEDGVLYIINCGQHPPYFFGGPEMDSRAKLDLVEYMGQEVFYDAGGSSVRGRTPGGHLMTVARLGRENLRYGLVATVIETVHVDPSEHEKYNTSWPIIKGRIPMPDEELIAVWPCNHLGFAYGDITPELAEVAHRLDIGFTIYDREGRRYQKPT
jgi:L-fucose isomerase-like protein